MLIAPLLIFAALAPELPTKPKANCVKFLAGHWIGKGTVTGFGRPVKVDNDYTFRADGSFTTINNYERADGQWTKQVLSGTWKAASTKVPRECTLSLEGGGASAGTSSSSNFEMIAGDTFRSAGFNMTRVR